MNPCCLTLVPFHPLPCRWHLFCRLLIHLDKVTTPDIFPPTLSALVFPIPVKGTGVHLLAQAKKLGSALLFLILTQSASGPSANPGSRSFRTCVDSDLFLPLSTASSLLTCLISGETQLVPSVVHTLHNSCSGL